MAPYVVTAIVRPETVARVKAELSAAGVRGVTVTAARGYGEYKSPVWRDSMSRSVRIEVFVADARRADDVFALLLAAARTGAKGDGLVAILPLERLFRIRTGMPVDPGDT